MNRPQSPPVTSLEAKWYCDPEVYARERELIFRNSWWLLCPVDRVAEPGDYICDRICGWPVMVLRASDGSLQGFLNICRHRGASLLPDGQGSGVDSIRCPYHGWLYSDHGELLKAPKFGGTLADQWSELSLHRIDVRLWKGLVFVRIATDEEETFEQWLGEMARLLDEFPGPTDLDYYDEFSVCGRLNWKTYCDNTVEGYHLNLIHPRIRTALSGGEVKLFSINEGRTVVFDVRYANDASTRDLRGDKGMWIYHFPGFQLVLGKTLFKAERIDSDAYNQVRSRNWNWYAGLTSQDKQSAFEWSRQIVEEDFNICSTVTANLRSGGYAPGPLSPSMEQHVARFQQIVVERLNRGDLSP